MSLPLLCGLLMTTLFCEILQISKLENIAPKLSHLRDEKLSAVSISALIILLFIFITEQYKVSLML